MVPLNNTSILLTGGTGFFGRAILRFLIDAESKNIAPPYVTLLTRSPRAFIELYPEFGQIDWICFYKGDILDPSSFPPNQNFTHLLHAAADSTNGPQLSPLERYNQIVCGTRNLLDYAIKQHVPRFLLTSSGGVYGSQPSNLEKITETCLNMPDPLFSGNAYSVAKRAAEHLCSLYADQYGLETVIARCFAFVGPDLPLAVHFAIGNFIRDALQEEQITVLGDGTSLRTYMDQRDLAEWLLTMLYRGKACEAYNVGSDEIVNISQLAHRVRDLISPGKSVKILGKSIDGQDRNRYVPNIDKARQTLGLNLRYNLEQGIICTAEAAAFKMRDSAIKS